MKVGIVGCGGIAGVHAESIKVLKKNIISAFADSRKERAEAFAEKYGGTAYQSLEEMLEKENLDVLHICTPHYLHVPMTVRALAKGIHVYQEKPAAISKEQYRELCRAAQEGCARLAISYQNRYNPCVQKAKELLDTGTAGQILGGRAFVTWCREEAYYKDSGWRGSLAAEGGGCLMNQAVHTLDLLTELMGTPLEVEAKITNHHLKDVIEVEDTVEAYITYSTSKGICHGNFYATTAFCTDSAPLIEIVCEKMTLRIEDPDLTLIYPDKTRVQPQLEVAAKNLGKAYWGSGHNRAIQEFYEGIQNGNAGILDLKNTDASNRLMLAVYESAKKGKAISITE